MIGRTRTRSRKRKRIRIRRSPLRNLRVTQCIVPVLRTKTFMRTIIWPDGSNSQKRNGTPY